MLTRVCDSQQFIMGPEVRELERELADWLGVEAAVAVSSGTDALLVSLMALGVGPGDEVVTSTYSFFATAGSIARLGATPVLVDIEASSFNIDPDEVRRAMTERTRAIIPVHLFGLCANMSPIVEVAREAGIAVIEDARPGDWRNLSGDASGRSGNHRVLFVLSEQEPGGVRRRRINHDRG